MPERRADCQTANDPPQNVGGQPPHAERPERLEAEDAETQVASTAGPCHRSARPRSEASSQAIVTPGVANLHLGRQNRIGRSENRAEHDRRTQWQPEVAQPSSAIAPTVSIIAPKASRRGIHQPGSRTGTRSLSPAQQRQHSGRLGEPFHEQRITEQVDPHDVERPRAERRAGEQVDDGRRHG